jgi:hypothetical protein
VQKRPWRLDVVDADGERVFEVPFAAVDPLLDHLEPELRALVERLCESERQLAETIFTERLLVMWNRETPPPVSPANPISRLCSVSGYLGASSTNVEGGRGRAKGGSAGLKAVSRSTAPSRAAVETKRSVRMSLYHFNLRDGGAGILDAEGTELPDLSAAKIHAVQVARELLRPNAIKKRAWRLDVHDSEGKPVFEVPFAQVDPTLDHLEPGLRELIERLAESRRRLEETMFASETLALHIRACDARRMGKPYLAARLGQRVDLPPGIWNWLEELRPWKRVKTIC